MLTPQDITNTTLKSGMGYKKKEVEAFLLEIQKSYLELYKENEDLKEKASVLSEGVQYYKNLEKTLQKSLVLAEKTSNETITTAESKARAIEQEAKTKANMMINDAQKELNQIHNQIISLIQQYEKYRTQCKQLASTQLELLDSNSYDLKIPNLDEGIIPTTNNFLNNEMSKINNEVPKMDDEMLRMDDEREKKKISFDLKENGATTIDFLKKNEMKNKDMEDDKVSKVSKHTVVMNETPSVPVTTKSIVNEIPHIPVVTKNVTNKTPSVPIAAENVIGEKKEAYKKAEDVKIKNNVQFDTRPLPEVKEIFMNAHKEESFLKKEVTLSDIEQRNVNVVEETGALFSDERGPAEQRDFSQVHMNNHNSASKDDDIGIDDVLSRLKKSFK